MLNFIDTRALLSITVCLFSITGCFMLLAFNIRKIHFYLWLSTGCFSFALGWILFIGRFFYGKNLFTLPLANIFILALPILINYGIRDFFKSSNPCKNLKRDLVISAILFLHLWLTINHSTWPGLSSSLVNAFYYFSIAKEMSKHRIFYHQTTFKLIQFSNLSVSVVLLIRAILLTELFSGSNISQSYLANLLHSSLLINIFAVHAQVLCFPLLDFIQTQNELEISNQKLSDLAKRDSLTGLFNRRALNTFLENITLNSDQAISVILLDVDHFKTINDQYGHLAGDQVLIHLAAVMSQNCRPTDTIFRYGGEEFIIFLSNTKMVIALQIAERLRHATATTPLPTKNMPLPPKITASFGVAQLKSHWTYDQLLQAADQELYMAKNAGRNCIHPPSSH